MGSDQVLTLYGAPLSPGLAEGLVHVQRDLLGPIDAPETIQRWHVDHECSRLDAATKIISEDLALLAARVEREIDARLAGVFEAHQLIADDSSLNEELKREIVENLMTASSAVKTVFLRWEKRFLVMESQAFRSRGDDIRDVSLRLSNALAGIKVHALEQIPHGCVLVASRLLPSDTVFLAGRSVCAALLEFGSAGSHAALFAREMGLPCISGLEGLVGNVHDGVVALVDADRGAVSFNPRQARLRTFRRQRDERERACQLAREQASLPAVTRDGVRISVLANVGCDNDTENAMRNGAEGVGLYRIERAYIGRVAPPEVEELVAELRQTLRPARGHPVCVRLLDIGADKPLPFLRFLSESNPALGRRGIRLLRAHPDLLRTQLRAILELSREFDVSVLIPMVTTPGDCAVVREALVRHGREAGLPSLPPLGAMLETPAAVLSAREIAEHVDFMSFGTNDLAQYAVAADRESAAVEKYFAQSTDVVLRMLRMTRADLPRMPLSICGELAGHPEQIPALLGCGIRTFSVAPPLVPAVKEAIRCSDSSGMDRKTGRLTPA